jgi:hypothetical protein
MVFRYRRDDETVWRTLPDIGRKLVLTYDDARLTDGAGAQLQRIYAIYSVSRLLGVPYLHSPLARVDYQGLSTLADDAMSTTFHEELNALLRIDSDPVPPGELYSIRLPDLSLKLLELLVGGFDKNETGGRPLLLRLATPYGIADRFPDCYRVCKSISPFAAAPRDGRPLRIALHVRRGDLLAIESHRMLPNAYYVAVARSLTHLLDALAIDYRIELHTELPVAPFTVQPTHRHVSGRVNAPLEIRPEMSRLEDFDELPHLVRCINDTAAECLRKLATADILVMSRSSLSYLGGILNKTGAVLYHPFWHAPLSSWITVAPDGAFDGSRLKALLGA